MNRLHRAWAAITFRRYVARLHKAVEVGPGRGRIGPGQGRQGFTGRVLVYAAELHDAEDAWSRPFVDRGISPIPQDDAVPWSSFEPSNADRGAASGYRMIGRLVRERRRQLGISQQHLGRLSGVDQSVISRLENGKLTSLRWSRFATVVRALGGLGTEECRGYRHA